MRRVLIVLCALGFAGSMLGATPDPTARAAALAAELRCLVCQNQSIAESNAELAVDLRKQIRSQIEAGRTDAEIRDFMVARYGDFVLYRPPWQASTVLLWLGPVLLLGAGFWLLRRALVRREREVEPPVLTHDERARAARLLDDGAP